MIKGRTTSGFEFEVDENAVNNMELVDALAEASSDDDLIAVSRVCKLLLDKKTKKALYDHVRTEDGRVPVDQVSKEVMEIFASFGNAGKN